MSDKQSKRPREARQSREDREERVERVRQEIRYVFRVKGRMDRPDVRGREFRLNETVSTSLGPCKVREIFWESNILARVLLELVD
jgi:hypothetical protein